MKHRDDWSCPSDCQTQRQHQWAEGGWSCMRLKLKKTSHIGAHSATWSRILSCTRCSDDSSFSANLFRGGGRQEDGSGNPGKEGRNSRASQGQGRDEREGINGRGRRGAKRHGGSSVTLEREQGTEKESDGERERGRDWCLTRRDGDPLPGCFDQDDAGQNRA